MATSETLSVMLIGCGNIAGGFDSGRKADALPFTHAGAYRKHGRYKLKICIEPDQAKRAVFMREWSVDQGFDDIFAAADAGVVCDVVSICSPTISHWDNINQLLDSIPPRLVFCEKPVTFSESKTLSLLERCEEMGISMAVNYNRRWDPLVVRLREEIKNGDRGALRSVTGFYNKGILNNGSHMFDLLRFLLGELTILSVGMPIEDYSKDDPTLPVSLRATSGIPIFLNCGDSRDYSLFELQFVFSSGVLAIEEGGQQWRERTVMPSKDFVGYNKLCSGHEFFGADEKCMLQAVSNIYHHVRTGEELISTGRTALAAQRLCEQAIQMASI